MEFAYSCKNKFFSVEKKLFFFTKIHVCLFQFFVNRGQPRRFVSERSKLATFGNILVEFPKTPMEFPKISEFSKFWDTEFTHDFSVSSF